MIRIEVPVTVLSERAALMISWAINASTYAVVLGLYILLRTGDLLVTDVVASLMFLGLLPVLTIILDSMRGKTDIFVSRREQRPFYFVFAIASYAAGYAYFRYVSPNYIMSGFLLAYIIVTLAMTLVSLKWKASVHACGISGPTTYLALRMGPAHSLLYVVLIPVYVARLRLNAHTPKELALGTAIGIVFTMVTVLLTHYLPL